MNRRMISILSKKFKLSGSEAEALARKLPKAVLNMYREEGQSYQSEEFFSIAKRYMLNTEVKDRLDKNIKYLIIKLKSKFSVEEVSKIINVHPNAVTAFYEHGTGLSLLSINELSALVGLTIKFEPVEQYYESVQRVIEPPTMLGFIKERYDTLRAVTRLPPPNDIGFDTFIKCVVLGDGDSNAIGAIKSVDDMYLDGAIKHGDFLLTLNFNVIDNTMRWIESCAMDTPERVIVTIGSTNLTAVELIAAMCVQHEGVDVRLEGWTTFIKVPNSKRIDIKFLSDNDVYVSKLDLSHLRLEPRRNNHIIIGGTN